MTVRILIQCCDPEDKGCGSTCYLETGGEGSEEGVLNFTLVEDWKAGTFQTGTMDVAGLHFACPDCSFVRGRRRR